MNAEGNIHNEHDFLKKTGHRSPFSTPENYFNELESTILNRVTQKQTVFNTFKTGSWISVAASVFILVSVSLIFYPRFITKPNVTLSFEETTVYEVDEIALIEVLELKQAPLASAFENEIINNVDEQTLIESL